MKHDSDQWISISDLMSGLMLVFLFVSIGYMIEVEYEREKMQNILLAYKQNQLDLNKALHDEFGKDLNSWNAEILENNSFRFRDPEMLFEVGRSDLREKFKNILSNFFPRYIKILNDNRFKDEVEEIRIEGHTSSNWTSTSLLNERYIHNAKLSQDRAFYVLDYCFNLKTMNDKSEWLIKLLRANGVSFANPVFKNGVENVEQSRRVEFRVITKVESKIADILNTIEK